MRWVHFHKIYVCALWLVDLVFLGCRGGVVLTLFFVKFVNYFLTILQIFKMTVCHLWIKLASVSISVSVWVIWRITNQQTFKSMPILNSAYHAECRLVIRHITQTETETLTELLRRHMRRNLVRRESFYFQLYLKLHVDADPETF